MYLVGTEKHVHYMYYAVTGSALLEDYNKRGRAWLGRWT